MEEEMVCSFKRHLLEQLNHLHPVFKDSNTMPSNYTGYITVHKGDVTDAKVHVIAVPVSADYRGGSGVSGMLFRRTKDSFMQDYQKCALEHLEDEEKLPLLLPVKDAQRGGLRDAVLAVCFVPVSQNANEDTYDDMYRELLRVYTQMLLKVDQSELFDEYVTIAFPLLGAGNQNYPAQISAEAAFSAFELFQSMKHKKKISVSLIVMDEADFMAVQDTRRFLLFKDVMRQMIEAV